MFCGSFHNRISWHFIVENHCLPTSRITPRTYNGTFSLFVTFLKFSCYLFHCQVCLLVSSGLNCGRFWQQSQCHNTWHLIRSLNPTAFFRSYTFSPVRLKSRYVSIQENRAFRKASYDDTNLTKSPEIRHFSAFIYLSLTSTRPSQHGSIGPDWCQSSTTYPG